MKKIPVLPVWLPVAAAVAFTLAYVPLAGAQHDLPKDISGVPYTWSGAVSSDWFEPLNWDAGEAPPAAADVVISGGQVVLSNAAPEFASFTMSNGTLVFTNWQTKLTAVEITLSGGKITSAGPVSNGDMTNRVWLAGSNLTVGASALIDVNEKGYRGGNYAAGHGPGGGARGGGYASGGSHGGYGGVYAETLTLPYGTPEEPYFVGSGGGSGSASDRFGGNGGGAVRLDFTGKVTIDGKVTANGGTTASIASAGGGGGSIRIACETLAGAGLVAASGGNGVSYAGGGGGGRIAVYYDVAKQLTAPKVRILAAPGLSPNGATGATGHLGAHGGAGSVWLPNTLLLPTNVTAATFSGAVHGIGAWSPATLNISNSVLQFPADGFLLSVSGAVTVAGADGRLALGGINMFNIGARWPLFDNSQAVALRADSLTITNGGRVMVFSAPTNGLPQSVGAEVEIRGNLNIFNGGWLHVSSNPTNGGSPVLRMANLNIAEAGCGINGSSRGYQGGEGVHYNGYGPGGGTGPSGGGHATAGGHGGRGGASATYPTTFAPTYGDYSRPLVPGSGGGRQGGTALFGGSGGGVVRVEAQNTIVIEGVITANGFEPKPYGGSYYVIGGGAGGSVFLKCRRLSGNGSITAKGGSPYSSGSGGGGGRIALWYVYASDNLALDVKGGTNDTNSAYSGDDGTTYRRLLPAEGTVFVVR